MELFVGLRYLLGKRKRKVHFVNLIAFISAGGVFLGSMVLVVALSIANGFEKEVRDRIIGMFAHARITQYFGKPIENADSLRQILLKQPGVLGVSPFLSGKGSVEKDGAQEGVLMMGIDDSLESTVTELAHTMKFGTLTLDSVTSHKGRKWPGVIIGAGLADKMGVRDSDEIILGTLAAGNDDAADLDPLSRIRAGRYTVAGVFETGMYEYDLNLVYVSMEQAREMFNIAGVEGLQIRTSDIYKADVIAEKAVEGMGGYPFKSVDWKAQNRSLFKWMQLERLIIFIVISLIIIVAAFNIICSLIMMILEKRREIGILMSMGATTQSIMKIFMLSGVVIGVVGSTVGVALGTLLCWLQQHFGIIALPGDLYFINKVPVQIAPLDILVIYISCNLICFLATLYPAWQASRILPAESIRFE